MDIEAFIQRQMNSDIHPALYLDLYIKMTLKLIAFNQSCDIMEVLFI